MTAASTEAQMQEFIEYCKILTGDEKGEAHVFCDRLFKAFGHKGYKEAGASLEFRLKSGKTTKYADLMWKPRLLIEMKGKGEELSVHYKQAFDYWVQSVPHRPRYVVLCNFDELWIYDFDLQLDEPVDRVRIDELLTRYSALNFLFPEPKQPIFKNDLIAVTRSAADKVAKVFRLLTKRGEERATSQRFVLQCVMALFSEDFGLLPKDLFTELLHDCKKGASSYDLLGHLFAQMNSPTSAKGGRYKDVRYFNGGLFAEVTPIELQPGELELLLEASKENWAKVKPPIFGTLFQSSMDKDDRHAYGAHFTNEADITKVVGPTIERPWRKRIDAAKHLHDLLRLRRELNSYQVLDPACGSGNFLYIAYLQLRRLENDIRERIHASYGRIGIKRLAQISSVSLHQFHGIDNLPFAVELAKVTLVLAKEIAIREAAARFKGAQANLIEQDLPLDNLDANIRCDDALFCEWPKADAIVGNPPYQSKNKVVRELGRAYVDKVRQKFADIPGRADYCVYWFRRAHDELPSNGRAGLVGTNTIRQNYSRQGGLDYILQNGGTITEAVSTQVWSGDAVVHVSIVNWKKGKEAGNKRLFIQEGDSVEGEWQMHELPKINSALSAGCDVTSAVAINANKKPLVCSQGQTHGNDGFLLVAAEVKPVGASKAVIHPYLIGDDMLGTLNSAPTRSIIDLSDCADLTVAMSFESAFARVREHVLPVMKKNAEEERKETGKQNGPRQSHLKHWWKLWRARTEIMPTLMQLPRYIACVRVTKRPIFEFVSPRVHPNDSLQLFAFADDYSFGILQSGMHWEWFKARCSTLKGDPRYTSETVFASFVWPQDVTPPQVQAVAAAAVKVRKVRREVMVSNNWTLRNLYRSLEMPGANVLRDAQAALDKAVRNCYGIETDADTLEFLLELNQSTAKREKQGLQITRPGLPPCCPKGAHITTDCITPSGYSSSLAAGAKGH